MLTQATTSGYTDAQLASLNDAWRQIVLAQNLEPDTDEYVEAWDRFVLSDGRPTFVYASKHASAVDIAETIARELLDMPAPDENINWADVGDLTVIGRELGEVLDRIRGNNP